MHDLGVVVLPGAPSSGSVLHRRCVRAVVRRERDVLLVEAASGELMLPGGGVDEGETDDQAVRREVREETGATVTEILGVYAEVVEHASAREADVAIFATTSRYLACRVAGELGEQQLEDYERAWGLRPVWLDVDEAVARVRAGAVGVQRHRERELRVLERLAAES